MLIYMYVYILILLTQTHVCMHVWDSHVCVCGIHKYVGIEHGESVGINLTCMSLFS